MFFNLIKIAEKKATLIVMQIGLSIFPTLEGGEQTGVIVRNVFELKCSPFDIL